MHCQENNTYHTKLVEYDKYCFKSKEEPKYVKKETSYCVGCNNNNNNNNNKNIKGVALENKIGQKKSTCGDCDSKKSTFLKRVNNKKWFSQITKRGYLLQLL